VPILIGHLSHAVNAGGYASYINTLSIRQAKGLLKNLRDRVHQFSIEQAETSGGKTSLAKMGAYFGQLNSMNRESEKVSAATVEWNARKVLGGRLAMGAVGGAAVVSLSGVALAAAGAGALGAAAGYKSMDVKNPKVKAFLQRNAVRGLAAGGLGALSLATVPWLAVPAMAAGSGTGGGHDRSFPRGFLQRPHAADEPGALRRGALGLQ